MRGGGGGGCGGGLAANETTHAMGKAVESRRLYKGAREPAVGGTFSKKGGAAGFYLGKKALETRESEAKDLPLT